MTNKEISRFLFVGLCITVSLIASIMGGIGQNYSNPNANNDSQSVLGLTDVYRAAQDPYTFNGPQAALDQASAAKAIKKMNYGYYEIPSEDNWHYWASMWLNGPYSDSQALGMTDVYRAAQDPYTFNGPQAALDQAIALRAINKMNYGYYEIPSEDNWHYWASMWLNGY